MKANISTQDLLITGDKVLIKLHEPYADAEEGGLVRPLYKVGETEGGRFIARLDEKDYVPVGTIVGLSPYAKTKLEEWGTPLEVGNDVFIASHVLDTRYQFFPNRHLRRVVDYEGYLLIPFTSIEAHVK